MSKYRIPLWLYCFWKVEKIKPSPSSHEMAFKLILLKHQPLQMYFSVCAFLNRQTIWNFATFNSDIFMNQFTPIFHFLSLAPARWLFQSVGKAWNYWTSFVCLSSSSQSFTFYSISIQLKLSFLSVEKVGRIAPVVINRVSLTSEMILSLRNVFKELFLKRKQSLAWFRLYFPNKFPIRIYVTRRELDTRTEVEKKWN